MGLGHEKLDVSRLALGYVAWVYEKADGLTGNHRSARPYQIGEEPSTYGSKEVDADADSDFDLEKKKTSQPERAGDSQ